MSLILEALRRSEAERQRGKAPGLFVEQQALSRRRRRAVPPWALPVAAVLLLAVAAGWAWREFARGDADVAAEPSPAATTPSPPVSATPPPSVTATPSPSITATPAPSVSAAPSPPAAAPEPPRVAAATPLPAATPAPHPVPTPDPAPSPPVVALPEAVPDPVATVDTPAIAPAPDTDAALPGFASLPAAERAALPPLKLSMHVYSDEPARRFVIVDGQRLVEGATPAPGVVVEAIRRDGAVLAVNGRRVLLARP